MILLLNGYYRLKKIFYFSVFLVPISLISQEDHTVETFPNRYRFSFETVHMPFESDLGFVGINYDIFNLINQSPNIYGGIGTYSTLTGIRPGLITLGISGGYRKSILFKNLNVDFGGFIGGGGGGGAADGGGLIVRPHLNLEYNIGAIGLQIGASHLQFPTGEIKSTQINAGITISSFNYFATENKPSDYIQKDLLKTNKLRVSLVGTQYYNFSKNTSVERPQLNNGKVGLFGAQLEREINTNLYGIFKLNGAVTGGADGYMNIFLGLGGKLPILNNQISLESRVLAGPSGGGSILSGGGATVQAEIGTSIKLFDQYDLKAMWGKTFAPWGNYASNHIEIGIGRSFDNLFPNKTTYSPQTFKVSASDYYINRMSFSTFNRTYFPPYGQTKNVGRYYQSYFNLLGFEVEKYLGKRFAINGLTVWAYQGDYGAYAEGLLGFTYYQPITSTFKIKLKALGGAAGGGAIDLGSGLIGQAYFGMEKELNPKWAIFTQFGKLIPLAGNFKPALVDIGIKFKINQLLKKEN